MVSAERANMPARVKGLSTRPRSSSGEHGISGALLPCISDLYTEDNGMTNALP